MHTRIIRIFLIVSSTVITLFLLQGCVTFLDAVNKGPIKTDASKRSFGEKMDDRRIRTIAAVNIKKADPVLDKSKISVYAYKGVLLLTGQLNDPRLKKLAGETARKVARVRQVHNEIELLKRQGFWSNVNDNLIETNINSKLMLHKKINANTIKVIVENHTAYLMGTLNKEDTERITSLVRKVRGVRKVIRAIEYIE